MLVPIAGLHAYCLELVSVDLGYHRLHHLGETHPAHIKMVPFGASLASQW